MYVHGVSTYFCELEVKILDLKGFAVFCQFVQFTEVTMWVKGKLQGSLTGIASCIKFCDPMTCSITDPFDSICGTEGELLTLVLG